ncbi:hypothetical protein RRG08_008474 [Elysia crispata]|uniref:Uncharacterized protein n=1 Tax=Elysia crispata TaxID=231223 RepID=A0AAE1DBI8_9GAST|nr:hypothetical protein RRG08_008474 [Elysia crispata]
MIVKIARPLCTPRVLTGKYSRWNPEDTHRTFGEKDMDASSRRPEMLERMSRRQLFRVCPGISSADKSGPAARSAPA